MTERDTKFAGFASLLMRELGREAIKPDHDWNSQSGVVALEQIIAQRAYDLVDHVLNSLVNDHLGIDYDLHHWPNEQLIDEYIPDLTQWPDSPTPE